MKTIFLILSFVLSFHFAFAQSKNNITEISTVCNMPGIAEAITFHWSQPTIQQFKSKPSKLEIAIQIYDDLLKLELNEINIFSNEFACLIKSDKREKAFYPDLGKYYSGKVNGVARSSVTISIRQNKVFGVIRLSDKVYNLAYSEKIKKQFIYEESDIKLSNTFSCEQRFSENYREHITQSFTKSNSVCENAVEVYFECDYDMYLNFSSDSVAIANYVVDLFAEINNLYAAENVPILISGISIWATNDPYTEGVSGLYDFQQSLNSSGFSGDLAHLLTNDAGSNGGVAYVDELCGNSPFAYSDINNAYELYPAYSWDVQVVAHELGHNLGSRHTHDCVWGELGNEQIDDCGNIHSIPTGNCYDPNNSLVPSNGGTVMSYCHLDEVGIDFLSGFGIEPGSLIRDKVSSCKCNNQICASALVIEPGSYSAEPSSGNGASNPNAVHSDWFKFVPEVNGTISISSCGGGRDTRVWLWQGDCNQLTYITLSDDDCDMGNGSNYASAISAWAVSAGIEYLIEWDNRWSSGEFDWTFEFTPDIVLMENCDDEFIMVSGFLSDTLLHAKMTLSSDAHIINGYHADFYAGQSFDFLPGFEVENGASFNASLEDCNY